MGFFTARNRQNPFAERKRREREQRSAELAAAPVSSPEPPAPKPEQLHAAPVELNPDSAEYTQVPDISTYEPQPEPIPVPAISAETQAKIDAVVNHAIPPVADEERPGYPGPRDAEHMRLLTEHAPVIDEPKRGRGRPRPQETVDRDNAVHALLVGADAETGISKESIAAALEDVKEQQVYSSLRQLTKEGRAETRYVKGHGYRWFAL